MRRTRVPFLPCLRFVVPFLVAGMGSHAGAETPLLATRITEANASRTIQGGPDAIGGLGDWALHNGTVCAVISDPAHESDAQTTGGVLVDLGLCDRNDDQFALYVELLNNSPNEIVPSQRIEADADDDRARITVFSGRDGVDVETRYEVDLEKPRRLRIETHVVPGPDGTVLSGFGTALVNMRGLSPFTVSTDGSAPSWGFPYPSYADEGLAALADAATAADLVVGVGARELEPGVAYGQRVVGLSLEGPTGERTPLPRFFLVDAYTTIVMGFSRSFWLASDDDLSVLGLLESQLMNLSPGSKLVLEQEIWVGERSDVASVTNLLFPDAPLVNGRVDAPAVLHVDRAEGGPLTQLQVREAGAFSLRLPAGAYEIRARAAGGRELRKSVEVAPGGTDVGLLQLGAPGRVALPRDTPMRLTFIGINGTPDPDFHDDLLGFAAVLSDGELFPIIPPERTIDLSGGAGDPQTVAVRPGSYRVLGSRGPEFSLTSTEIEVSPGGAVDLALAAPVRVLETPGVVSADFHIHSAPSPDNGTDPVRQVANTMSSGSEVLVASEHDHVFDFAPTIQRLGLGDELPSLVGIEVTSEVSSDVAPMSIGHANAFPVPVRPLEYRRGVVPNEGRRWRDVIADLRSLPGERVIQLNHARFDDGSVQKRAYLSHMGPAQAPFDPTLPLTTAPNDVLIEPDPQTGVRDVDFDAMELLNGPHMPAYERNRADWFAFLRQGVKIHGTANSDSHLAGTAIGTPRNYVRYEGEVRPASQFDEQRFVAAIRDGGLYGTTGPIVDVTLAGVPLGGTVRGTEAVLRVSVRAAPWVGVSELRVFVSGEPAAVVAIAAGETVEVPLAFERDAFVTTEIRGEPSEDYEAVLPGFEPFAFTNPIWVDVDGDGEWTPPGVAG